jgi:CHAT domain-containing protein/tetratricopeptide (TPR) repeat protein
MFRSSKRLLLLIGVSILCPLVAFGLFKGKERQPQTAAVPAQKRSWKGTLPRDVGKIYKFSLDTGQLLHVSILQQGADVALVLVDPLGENIFLVDSPLGNQGTEHVFLVAPSKGNYGIRVQDGSEGTYRGDYHLRIEELRTAGDRDRENAECEKAFYTGKSLAGKKLFQRAEAEYSRAIKGWRKLNNRARLADAFEKLGDTKSARADWKGALGAYQERVALRSSLRDWGRKADALVAVARMYEAMGGLQQAEASYLQELEIRIQLQEPKPQAQAHYNLARVQRERGGLEDALAHFTEAITSGQALKDVELQIKALGGRGQVYYDMGRSDLALDDYEQGLNLLKARPSSVEKAVILTQKGFIYGEQGRVEEATDLLEQALTLRRAINNPLGEAITLNNFGTIYYRANRLGDALDAFTRAAQIFKAERDIANHMAAMINLGWIHAVQGRPEIALRILNQALGLARQGGNTPAEAKILHGMALAERKRGNPRTARDRIEKAIDVMESLRGRTQRRDLRRSYLESREDLYSFKIELLMDQHSLQPRVGFDLQAFQTSERARARVLYEALADERQSTDVRLHPEVLEQKRRTQEAINSLDQQLRHPSLSEAERQQREMLLRKLIGQNEGMEATLRASSGHWERLPPSLSLWEIQKQVLDDETILLEYYLYKDRSFLWAVTPSAFRSYELPCLDLGGLAGSVHQLLADGKAVSAEDWERLSNCTLGPVAGLLRDKRIVVVAHGELQKIPFAALTDPSAEGAKASASGIRQVLALRREVVSLPSVSVLARLRKQRMNRRPGRKFLALVGDAVYSLNDDRLSYDAKSGVTRKSSSLKAVPYEFSRLRGAREEAREILSLASGRTFDAALAFQATREWVMQGHLADSQIVHFGTHGVLNEVFPELSGLVLSQFDRQGHPRDGLLRSHEIDDLNLKADLVVLSACQTALGKDVRGEGLIGLTHSFMVGGASAVLVSLWKVDDRATAELMKYFYRFLIVQHLTPAAALRHAQLRMIENNHWRSPFFWSGFVLQGDWEGREPQKKKKGH